MSLLLSTVRSTITVGNFTFEIEPGMKTDTVNVYMKSYKDISITPTRMTQYSIDGAYVRTYGTSSFIYQSQTQPPTGIMFADSDTDALAVWVKQQLGAGASGYTYALGQRTDLPIGDFIFKVESSNEVGRVYIYPMKYKTKVINPVVKLTTYTTGSGYTYNMNQDSGTFYYGDPVTMKAGKPFTDVEGDPLRPYAIKIIEDNQDAGGIGPDQQGMSTSTDITVSPQVKPVVIDQKRYDAERSGIKEFTKPLIYETSIFTKYGRYILLGLGGILIYKAISMIAQEDDKEYKELLRIRRMKMNVHQKRSEIADKKKERIDLEKRMKEIDEITNRDEKEVGIANDMLSEREDELVGPGAFRNRDRMSSLYDQRGLPSEISSMPRNEEFPLEKQGGFDAGELNIGGGGSMLLGKGIDLAKDVAVKGVEKAGDVIQSAVPAFGQFAGKIVEGTGNVLGEGVKGITSGINTAVAGIAPTIQKGISGVSKLATGAIEGGVKLGGKVLGDTGKAIGAIAETGKEVVTNIGQNIQEEKERPLKEAKEEKEHKRELELLEKKAELKMSPEQLIEMEEARQKIEVMRKNPELEKERQKIRDQLFELQEREGRMDRNLAEELEKVDKLLIDEQKAILEELSKSKDIQSKELMEESEKYKKDLEEELSSIKEQLLAKKTEAELSILASKREREEIKGSVEKEKKRAEETEKDLRKKLQEEAEKRQHVEGSLELAKEVMSEADIVQEKEREEAEKLKNKLEIEELIRLIDSADMTQPEIPNIKKMIDGAMKYGGEIAKILGTKIHVMTPSIMTIERNGLPILQPNNVKTFVEGSNRGVSLIQAVKKGQKLQKLTNDDQRKVLNDAVKRGIELQRAAGLKSSLQIPFPDFEESLKLESE